MLKHSINSRPFFNLFYTTFNRTYLVFFDGSFTFNIIFQFSILLLYYLQVKSMKTRRLFVYIIQLWNRFLAILENFKVENLCSFKMYLKVIADQELCWPTTEVWLDFLRRAEKRKPFFIICICMLHK